MTQKNELFSDTLRINEIDRDGRYFEKVSRIEATGEETDCKVCLDVNVDVYPINKECVYSMLLASSLDGNPSDNKFSYEMFSKKSSLIDNYEYIMHGKIFKYSEEQNGISVYISFGGLILGIIGSVKVLKDLKVDERVYLLLKKVTNY